MYVLICISSYSIVKISFVFITVVPYYYHTKRSNRAGRLKITKDIQLEMKGADQKKIHHLYTINDSDSLPRKNLSLRQILVYSTGPTLFQKPFYALKNCIVMQCSHGPKIKRIPKQPYERKYGNSNKD